MTKNETQVGPILFMGDMIDDWNSHEAWQSHRRPLETRGVGRSFLSGAEIPPELAPPSGRVLLAAGGAFALATVVDPLAARERPTSRE